MDAPPVGHSPANDDATSNAAAHKKREDMMPYMFETDEYGHFVALRTDLAALCARLFYLHEDSPLYRGKRLQDAVDQSFLDKTVSEER